MLNRVRKNLWANKLLDHIQTPRAGEQLKYSWAQMDRRDVTDIGLWQRNIEVLVLCLTRFWKHLD